MRQAAVSERGRTRCAATREGASRWRDERAERAPVGGAVIERGGAGLRRLGDARAVSGARLRSSSGAQSTAARWLERRRRSRSADAAADEWRSQRSHSERSRREHSLRDLFGASRGVGGSECGGGGGGFGDCLRRTERQRRQRPDAAPKTRGGAIGGARRARRRGARVGWRGARRPGWLRAVACAGGSGSLAAGSRCQRRRFSASRGGACATTVICGFSFAGRVANSRRTISAIVSAA